MNKTIYLILLLGFTGCKKKEIQPAELVPGVYQMSTSATFRSNGNITKQAGTGILKVELLDNDLFEFTEDYGGYYRKYRVRISGQDITVIDGSTESLRINNNDYLGILSGKGVISSDGKSLNLDTISIVAVTGLSFTKSAFVSGTR